MDLVREKDFRWRIERTGQMRVPGIVFASPGLLPDEAGNQTLHDGDGTPPASTSRFEPQAVPADHVQSLAPGRPYDGDRTPNFTRETASRRPSRGLRRNNILYPDHTGRRPDDRDPWHAT